ncbi:hypothetical protein [Olivibacter sp. XZL3]|uniref:hypothetical protein n=1 Tax=Olivibacter sp. XZL3 TaxID=1735116 RepID=UPI0010652BB9|nr:hypothetical protein [Olivibacter sp. XZL3]
MVNKKLHYRSISIEISYEPDMVHITNNIDLWRFFEEDIRLRTDLLIDTIQQDYVDIFGKPLKIARKSLAVEIWGHLYFEYYLLRLLRFLRIGLKSKIFQGLIARSAFIDCGEKDKDRNRLLWDCLALFYGVLQHLLPKNIGSTGLKK